MLSWARPRVQEMVKKAGEIASFLSWDQGNAALSLQ
jgi:hypothetical protein